MIGRLLVPSSFVKNECNSCLLVSNGRMCFIKCVVCCMSRSSDLKSQGEFSVFNLLACRVLDAMVGWCL
jgi:hypothetical protein